MEVLAFEVDRQRYAVAVADVLEIVRAVAVVPLPRAPTVVQGVMDLRGELVPVLNLRARFGVAQRPVRSDEHFVVLRVRARAVALRVDRAHGLLHVDDAHVCRAASVVPRAEFVSGLATLPDGIVLIADAHAFLSEAESVALAESLDRGARAPAAVSA